MFTRSRTEILAAVERIGSHACAYSLPERGWSRLCYCKYGAERIGQHSEAGNGCPELRCVRLALTRMTDAEWDALMGRTTVLDESATLTQRLREVEGKAAYLEQRNDEVCRMHAAAEARLREVENRATDTLALHEQVCGWNQEARARIAELEAGLRPFAAEAAEWVNPQTPDDFRPSCGAIVDVSCSRCRLNDLDYEIEDLPDAAFTLGDLRRAKALLTPTPPPECPRCRASQPGPHKMSCPAQERGRLVVAVEASEGKEVGNGN